ncbi:MAG: hypothetical protein E7Z68_09640 [Thermoplasmata archaeon]|jgi:hypothetical protein|nr:hypothetical protein [Thermoplasmata archaeon]
MSDENDYRVCFKTKQIGACRIRADGRMEYRAFGRALESLKDQGVPPELAEAEKAVPYLGDLMRDPDRVEGTRRTAYRRGDVSVVRIPEQVERFNIYRSCAEKGDPDYSEESHSAPHREGPGTSEDMMEWAKRYSFDRMDDGTYEAELDEAWWWGGGHDDGGTVRAEIPEEWQSLPYDEFLENVISLVHARHYGFTVEHLKSKEGLKRFFGFEE